MQRRKGFTTMTDLDEFERTTWSFLTNVKMVWEYEGMAYLFRQEGIPLYGYEKGTTKMNHPVMGMVIPPSKDKNYGVDIYVPVKQKPRALKLIADQERLRACAELEAVEGPTCHKRFEAEARSNKERYEQGRRARRRERLRSQLKSLLPAAAKS